MAVAGSTYHAWREAVDIAKRMRQNQNSFPNLSFSRIYSGSSPIPSFYDRDLGLSVAHCRFRNDYL
jgi:hypothetical protein